MTDGKEKMEKLGKLLADGVRGALFGEGEWAGLKRPGARDILPPRPVKEDSEEAE